MKNVTRMFRFFAPMLACVGTLGLAPAAQADETDTAQTVTYGDVVVHYADLNLASAAGVKALYARLSSAAEKACGNEPKTPALERQLQFKRCYDRTLDRAVEGVGSQQVQMLHAAHKDSSVG